jgi:hypothetical protein
MRRIYFPIAENAESAENGGMIEDGEWNIARDQRPLLFILHPPSSLLLLLRVLGSNAHRPVCLKTDLAFSYVAGVFL